MAKKINNLKELQAELQRQQEEASFYQQKLKEDGAYLKEKLAPAELLNKLATTTVPEDVRHSQIINKPINYIARLIFHKDDVVDSDSDRGQGNRTRNIALGVVEALGTYLLTRYIRRKL